MNVSAAMLVTHVAYWVLAVALVMIVRKLRLHLEALAAQLERSLNP